MSKSIQIFKPGKHTAMSGVSLEFSESDLAASAKAYDPSICEAPLVIGHPKLDAPAYGWVRSLSFADGLNAEPHQVDAAFSEMVSAGRFKKVSASFYAPDSPSNPVPGVYYLRHVGFLGAQPPSVKGLKPVEFSDAEQGVVEFSEWDDVTNASLWRTMREWFIGKFGLDEADKVIPNYQVQSLEQGAQDELRESQKEDAALSASPAFSEPKPKGDEMSAEDKARLAALEQENAQLKARHAEFAEAEAKRKVDAAHADHVAFAETLVAAGKLLPATKLLAVAALDLVASQDAPVEFGEGDEKAPLTVEAVKDFLDKLPKQVDFGEHAGAGKQVEGLSDVEIAQRARLYKQKLDEKGTSISFAEAVDAVHAGKDK